MCIKYFNQSRFNSEHNWEGLWKRKINFTLDSYNFYILTLILKLEMAGFVIHNCCNQIRQFPSQNKKSEMSVDLDNYVL